MVAAFNEHTINQSLNSLELEAYYIRKLYKIKNM